jgi:ribosomal protein S19E (S16A)
MVEDLESLHYVETRDDQVFVTEAGERKLDSFIASLPEEDRKALEPELL